MTADPASVDPAEAMLAKLAGLDPPLARPARPPLGGRGAARRPHRAKLGLTEAPRRRRRISTPSRQ
ncbi:MAG TPA: hypothetical protein VF474_03895, partial [Phenylobacterium sp.]